MAISGGDSVFGTCDGCQWRLLNEGDLICIFSIWRQQQSSETYDQTHFLSFVESIRQENVASISKTKAGGFEDTSAREDVSNRRFVNTIFCLQVASEFTSATYIQIAQITFDKSCCGSVGRI